MSNPALNKVFEARQIVTLLARGLDPIDETEIPTDSCLNRPEVIRALLLASDALTAQFGLQGVTASQRKAIGEFPKAGQSWSSSEDVDLKSRVSQGLKLREIAVAHGRSEGAIISRLVRCGIVDSSDAARVLFKQRR